MKEYATIFNGLLKEFCKNEGVCEFAVTTAAPFYHLETLLTAFSKYDGGGAEFCEKDVKKRIDPALTLADAQSIICLLFPYKRRADGDLSELSDYTTGSLQGKISSGDVWLGDDYHVFIRKRLAALCSSLKETFGGNYMPFCDTGPLVDKVVAVRAGLCGYGRNNLAVNERLGTYFYIAYILTDVDLTDGEIQENVDPPFAVSSLCDNCRKCVNACPTGAISADKPFNGGRCVSYLSQKRGELTPEEAQELDDSLYGCMVCQSVCPLNETESFIKYVDLDEALSISNREFARKFSDTAAGFIGKKVFLRNSAAIRENAENRGKQG